MFGVDFHLYISRPTPTGVCLLHLSSRYCTMHYICSICFFIFCKACMISTSGRVVCVERGPCSKALLSKTCLMGKAYTPLFLLLFKQRCSIYLVPCSLLVSVQNPKGGVRGSGLQLLEGSEGLR